MSRKLSGAENRKKAKERKKQSHLSSSFLSSWLKENINEDESNNEPAGESAASLSASEEPSVSGTTEELLSCEIPVNCSEGESVLFDLNLNVDDPGTWPENLTDTQRCFIVSKLMNKLVNEPDISNTYRDGRKLSKDWFHKVLPNGEKINRLWLMLGKSMNSLYCLPCKLFAHTQSESKSSLVRREGFTNWKKVGERLSEHENSLNHKNCFCSWKNLEASLGKRGIDKDLQDEIEKEESHWKAVLHSVVDVILHLAKQGSPLRGSNETLEFSDPRSGKFLNTIELVSHYHPPLREHILRHRKGQVTYFSSKIQNEFLEIISNKIREQIMEEVKEAKYYAVMFDCTPDVSHLEQMSQVLRYVRVVENFPEITERFIDFFTVSDKTGIALSEEILKKIEQEGLDIKNCRGQSYDNGANMAGKYQGVQARISESNPLAKFVPCAAHTLNLVGVNAATAVHEVAGYFGTVNCLYTYFSASTNRWEVLLKYSPLALRKESDTRWSSRREALTVVHKHLDKIVEALNHLALDAVSSPETKSGAVSLLKSIQTFEFVAFTCFWQKTLKKIDIVSKMLQKEDIAIDVACNLLKGLTAQIKDCRDTIGNEVLEEAKQSCLALNVDPSFKEVRNRKKKRFFDEKCEDESSEISQHKKFKLALLQVNDRIEAELERRFQSMQKVNEMFGFLSPKQLTTLDNKTLREKATTLANLYRDDLDKDELSVEIESFKYSVIGSDNLAGSESKKE
ncbi:Zinc finger MYM-type protein 1 [Araneus ventricosus]|uniref:Zinc finger MYM-type protein 1 n=1 Tax=Araneus ventricosus TaxID=182803 RepID=A0A4Y2N7P2_ARAVE|nr:Zinc finger MYM-type protein 1 [Araneus ventricosus]